MAMSRDVDDLPGRTIADDDRLPFGLGWEHRRRKWRPRPELFQKKEDRRDYLRGYRSYKCSDSRVEIAMVSSGVPIGDSPDRVIDCDDST